MTNSQDSQRRTNNSDETQALELLSGLDLDAPMQAPVVATSPALSVVAKALNTRRARPAKSMTPSAIAERKRYEDEKKAAGKGEVRPYKPTDIAPRRLAEGAFETEEDYERRYKREHARLRRGVSAEDIDANAIIRELTTPEEKKRKRADAQKARRDAMTQAEKDADAERKRVKRAEKKATSSTG